MHRNIAWAEAAGLSKEKDLWAWKWADDPFPPRVVKAWEDIQAMPEVKLRSVDTKHMHRELETIMSIYNDAWSGKWGFVPATPEEVEKTAKDLALIVDPDIAFMADIKSGVENFSADDV